MAAASRRRLPRPTNYSHLFHSSQTHMPASEVQNLVASLTFLRSASASASASASSKKKQSSSPPSSATTAAGKKPSSYFTKKKTSAAADHQKKLSSTVSSSSSSKKKLSSSPSSPASSAAGKMPSSNLTKKKSSSSDHEKKLSSSASNDAALVKHLSSINVSSSSLGVAKTILKNFQAPPTWAVTPPPKSSLGEIAGDRFNSGGWNGDDGSAKRLSTQASDEMYLSLDDESDEEQDTEPDFDFSYFADMLNAKSLLRKEHSRMKKQRCVYNSGQPSKYDHLLKMCAKRLGANRTIDLFGKLGKETGVHECNAMIKDCIDNATQDTTDKNVTLEHSKVIHLLQFMRRKGFKIQEETYGQFLMHLIDHGMVNDFFSFCELIHEGNPDSLPRLAYYEMLLWIRVGNEVKIRELCQSAIGDSAEQRPEFREQLLVALCESDYKEEFLMLLRTLDITKIMPFEHLGRIFRTLGKLLLETYAEDFLLSLKRCGIGVENLSNFIFEYAISTPNLAVVDIIEKFQTLHNKLEVFPTLAQYEKLIKYCCESFKVHEALDLVDKALESGIALSLETFHLILEACDQSYEFNLVHRVALRISSSLVVKPNNETFRRMILLCVKMKDYDGAYRLIDDLQMMDLTLTATMYNTILLGYLREKNLERARNVLKQMEDADVKPDSVTYSYLIGSCQNEKEIEKFYNDMIESGICLTTPVFMAIINAYTGCGLFEKAKEVILDKRIVKKDLPKVKSVLVGTLASNGQFSEALQMYEEIKDADCYLNLKTLRSLVDHFLSKRDFSKLLQLMEELQDSHHWTEACFWVISHSVEEENLSLTIDLLKKLKDKFNDKVQLEVLFDEVFCIFAENEATDMWFGLNLLQAIKEELGVCPSRKSLDFLLSACVTATDSEAALFIWKEYEIADLPYNVLSYLRMLQALLASGDKKSARKILNKIPKEDAHVRHIIQACYKLYDKCEPVEKNKRALAATLSLLDALNGKPKR